MIAAELKQALARGEGQLGTFVKLSNATAIEALGRVGLDFAILDTEHAPNDQLMLEHMIRAADCVGLPTIVRVSSASEEYILKALDLGASGVQLPGLETVEEVRRALCCTKYAPMGCRGLSFSQRTAGYGTLDSQDYIRRSNEGLINVVHIENKAMAEQVRELCRIEEIDVLFVGPMDISQSLGHPGEPGHPEVAEVIQRVLRVCREQGKASGIFVGTPEAAQRYLDQGVSYVVIASDLGFMTWGYRQMRQCLEIDG